MLAYVTQYQVVRDGCNQIESCLAEFALEAVLGSEAVAAEGIHGGVGGFPGRLRCGQLAHVRLRRTWLVGVVQRDRGVAQRSRGAGRDVRARDRKLHALVLADRPAEYDALTGVA